MLLDHEDWVRSAAFSQDGAKMLTTSYDGTSKVWITDDAICTQTLEGHDGLMLSSTFASDGSILTTSSDATAKIWHADSGQCVQTFRGHYAAVHSAAYSPDGSSVLTASDDGTAKLWCVQSG